MAARDFDVIVIGSGFGGSVASAVLAEGGLRVCVLERGRAYPPGSFPRSPQDMRLNFWDPSEGYLGLFQLWSFRRTDAVVSSGLGGGSLIYANVMLRKPEDTYLRWDWQAGREVEGWPLAPESLRSSYTWVERRIGITPVPPASAPGYAPVRRTALLEDAGKVISRKGFPVHFARPPLAVTFAAGGGAAQPGTPIPYRNNVHTDLTGLPTHRSTCMLCGECDIGCNYGSKNSLDHTLLSDAAAAGADIRPLHEVTTLVRRGDGTWEVHARDRSAVAGAGAPGVGEDEGGEVVLTARRVVFAAGTLGSTYLLLRLRAQGVLDIGPALGRCFSGNGDCLTWVSGATERLDGDRGPVVTGLLTADLDGRGHGSQRAVYYVQDGGYPGLFAWLGETVSLSTPLRLARFAFRRWVAALRKDPNRRLARDVSGLIGATRATSTLPLLGIGMDVTDAQLLLRSGQDRRLDLKTHSHGGPAYYRTVSDMMARVAAALGGRFIENPLWSLRRNVTVHPLGGCPMGTDPESGVVDEHGRVFGYEDSLCVMDGSVMPGPIGPNPALTIAAFAERASRHLLATSAR